jgi:hypothetical protein
VNSTAYASLRRHQKAWLWSQFSMESLFSKGGALFMLGSLLLILTACMACFWAVWIAGEYQGAPVVRGSFQHEALASHVFITKNSSLAHQDLAHETPRQPEVWVRPEMLKPWLAATAPPSFASARAAAWSLKIWQEKTSKGEPIDLTEKGFSQIRFEISDDINRSWRAHQAEIKASLKFSACPYWEGLSQTFWWRPKSLATPACALVQETSGFTFFGLGFFFILAGFVAFFMIGQFLSKVDLLEAAMARIPEFAPWVETSGARHLTRLEAHKLRWASRAPSKSTKNHSPRL